MKSRILILFAAAGLLAALSTAAPQAAAPIQTLLLRNGRILPIAGAPFDGDILIQNGKIVRIGAGLAAPAGGRTIDLAGRWVMPGIIDSHSHIAIEGNVNESTDLMTPEVDVRDVLNPEDMNIWYALTGGVTTIHTMHGSANPIGGRGLVLKLRWGAPAEGLIFEGAPRTSKWALGENPKRPNAGGTGRPRYPQTRMGVEASIRKILDEGKAYLKSWDDYRAKLKAGAAAKTLQPAPLPPRRDFRLEAVGRILSGEDRVRCHAYQAEEMLSIMKLAKEYGLKLACFEHGLEGYRITNELVQYGVAVSTFADSWAYKWEAYYTMPHSAALMAKRGVLVALNSDDAERMRHLFNEAAKTVRFGGLSEAEALETLTINPAKILGVENRVGTIEVGKDADLAVFNRHPLDSAAVCQMTLVDGKIYFDRDKYLDERRRAEEERKKKEEEAKKPKDKKSGGEV
jgi:imidazolonepropionase-like amidohydrolase